MLFTGKVVMVIDDSYTIRHQVKLLLSKYDIIVIEAYDKKSMLNHLHYKGRLVDLILMDLGLKETTGTSLMRFLQNTENYKHIPIIVLTGDATKNTVLEVISAYKLEHYAIKPIDPKNLSNKVLTVLEKAHFSEHPGTNDDVSKRIKAHKTNVSNALSKEADDLIDMTENYKADKFSIGAKKEKTTKNKKDSSKYHIHPENLGH